MSSGFPDLSGKSLLILTGPTASGKTEVAREIAKRIPAEVISCDSMQVYRGMPITTQAWAGSGSSIPVHLVSFLGPSKEYSAALFREQATVLVSKIMRKDKTPIVVGGTGLYLRALLDGLFETDGPGVLKDLSYRKKMEALQKSQGGDFLHRQLKKIDALSAARIHPNDTRRLVRALEVFHLTGRPLSFQKSNRNGIRSEFRCRLFFLERERGELYERINRRVERMIRRGLVEEIRRVLRKKLSVTAGMALGVREIGAYLKGKTSLSSAVELLKKNTRNYAKRQISWFRHEKDVEIVRVSESDSVTDVAGKILELWKDPPEARGV